MTDSPPGPPTGGPPPGWYPDPYGQPGYRWWNGVAWTEDRWTGEGASSNGPPAVGDLLGETFRVLGQRIGHLFTLAAVIVILPTVAATGLLYSVLHDVRYQDGQWTGVDAGRVALGIVAMLATLIPQLVFTAAVSRHAMAALNGNPEPWSRSLGGGLRRAVRVLAANVAVWLPAIVLALVVVVVAGVLTPVLLVVAVPAVLVGLAVVWVRAGLVGTAAAVAPGGLSSVRTSFALSKGRFWSLFGRFLLLGLLWLAANMAGSFASSPVAGFADPAEDAIKIDDDTGELVRLDFDSLIGDNIGVIGFSLVVSSLVQAGATALTAIGRVSVYRSLAGPVEEALAPPADAERPV